jgi:hypothetical protein
MDTPKPLIATIEKIAFHTWFLLAGSPVPSAKTQVIIAQKYIHRNLRFGDGLFIWRGYSGGRTQLLEIGLT